MSGSSHDRGTTKSFCFSRTRDCCQHFRQNLACVGGVFNRCVGPAGRVGNAAKLLLSCGVGTEADRFDAIDAQINTISSELLSNHTRIFSEARPDRWVTVEISIEAFVTSIGEENDGTKGSFRDVVVGGLQGKSDCRVARRCESIHICDQRVGIDPFDRSDKTGVLGAVLLARCRGGCRELVAVDANPHEGVWADVCEGRCERVLGDIELCSTPVESFVHRTRQIDHEDHDLVGKVRVLRLGPRWEQHNNDQSDDGEHQRQRKGPQPS